MNSFTLALQTAKTSHFKTHQLWNYITPAWGVTDSVIDIMHNVEIQTNNIKTIVQAMAGMCRFPMGEYARTICETRNK